MPSCQDAWIVFCHEWVWGDDAKYWLVPDDEWASVTGRRVHWLMTEHWAKNTRELNDHHILCSDEEPKPNIQKSDTQMFWQSNISDMCVFQSANLFSWVIRAAGGILKSRKQGRPGGEGLCVLYSASQQRAARGKPLAQPSTQPAPVLGIRAFVCVRMWDYCHPGPGEFYITGVWPRLEMWYRW